MTSSSVPTDRAKSPSVSSTPPSSANRTSPSNMPKVWSNNEYSSQPLTNRQIVAVTLVSLASVIGVGMMATIGTTVLKVVLVALTATTLGAAGAAAVVYGTPALVIIGLLALAYYVGRSNRSTEEHTLDSIKAPSTTLDETPTSVLPHSESFDWSSGVFNPNEGPSPSSALADPSPILPSVVSQDVPKIKQALSSFTEDTWENMWNNLNTTELQDIEVIKRTIAFGVTMDTLSCIQLHPKEVEQIKNTFSPLELQIWNLRNEIASKARTILESHLHAIANTNGMLKTIVFDDAEGYIDIKIHDALDNYIADRDPLTHITRKFSINCLRAGELSLTPCKGDRLFPAVRGNAERTQENILQQLREFATISPNATMDPELFATLQESIGQNLEKPATEHRLAAQLHNDFGDTNFSGLVLSSWSKNSTDLKQVDPTHFLVTYDYDFTTIDPWTGNRKISKVEIVFPINNDSGSWIIGQPISTSKGRKGVDETKREE